MFGFDSDDILYGPRIQRNFYHPSQYSHPSRPCSYYHNNFSSPFYNRPEYFIPQNYFYNDDDDDDGDDEEDQREQILRERLNRKMAYKRQQEERERKASEQMRKQQQQQQQQTSTFTDNNDNNNNQQSKKSFKIKIQDGDETKSKVTEAEAAIKIFNFIKNKSRNNQTRKILNKLYELGKIENELKKIHETKNLSSLTFKNEDGNKILPISIENKNFLEYENKIMKVFDKLDGIQSEGADIIRERRKFIVKFAQSLLSELDNEKEFQWNEFNKKQLMNSEINVPVSSEQVITEDEKVEPYTLTDIKDKEDEEKDEKEDEKEDDDISKEFELVNDLVGQKEEEHEFVLVESNDI